MDRATLDRLKAKDYKFDQRYEELADMQTKNRLEFEQKNKTLRIKFISCTSNDGFYNINLAIEGRYLKSDNAIVILSQLPQIDKFEFLPSVEQKINLSKQKTITFKIAIDDFDPNKYDGIDFIAKIICDDLTAQTSAFQIGEKKNHTEKNKEYANEDDWIKAAKDLGVTEVNLIKAIAYQESDMIAFLASGNPKILYERHHFYEFYKNKYGKEKADKLSEDNPLLINSKRGGYGSEKFFQKDGRFDNEGYYNYQFDKLNKAIEINKDFAIMSTSFGVFQILGEYYNYSNKSAEEFYNELKKSEKNQIFAFVNFIKGDPAKKELPKALNEKKWELVASIYNGKSWKEYNPKYAENLKLYYEKKPWKKK